VVVAVVVAEREREREREGRECVLRVTFVMQ